MNLTPEEQAMIEGKTRELDLMQQQSAFGSQGHVTSDLQAFELREREKGTIKEQLSLSEELETIKNLLDGKILVRGENEKEEWVEPKDSEMKILTEHGVHLIMNTIMFYLNKNTLLSNYDDTTINKKMLDFSTDLADTIFMEYEKVFRYPTFEECKQVLMKRLETKSELRHFAYELAGKKRDKEEIKKEFVVEIENNIEREIEKIKEQIIKNKLKRFLILIREIQDAVHSTYLRAWNGQERRTLRQHIHVSENLGNQNMLSQQNKPKRGWW